MGRPATTGRYKTRKELEDTVWLFYKESNQTISEVARACRISLQTANSIIAKQFLKK